MGKVLNDIISGAGNNLIYGVKGIVYLITDSASVIGHAAYTHRAPLACTIGGAVVVGAIGYGVGLGYNALPLPDVDPNYLAYLGLIAGGIEGFGGGTKVMEDLGHNKK